MSKKHVLEFRADFSIGPKKFVAGDRLVTTVTSLVVGAGDYFRECFRVVIEEGDPDFDGLAGAAGEGWNGGVIVPCSFVRFAEEERPAGLSSDG